MRRIVQALLLAAVVGACAAANRDRGVVDASSGGTGGNLDTGGSPGARSIYDGAVSDDDCGLALGFPSEPPRAGSAPECPRCGPYSKNWDPRCTKEGITCEYLQPGGFGASCRCGGLDPTVDAGPDGGPRDDAGAPLLQFGCAL